MTRLNKYSKTPTASRREYDPTTCPSSCRKDVWSLGVLFVQLAAQEGLELPEGPFLVHDYLLHRFKASGVMEAPPELLLDSQGRQRTWDEMVEAAIRLFFGETFRDEHALEKFCNEATFQRMCRTVRERAYYHRLARKAEEMRAARA